MDTFIHYAVGRLQDRRPFAWRRPVATVDPVTSLGFAAFDADNHCYEALDAFTRHLPRHLGPRTVQWAEIDGRKYHVVGGRVSHAVVNPTFDPVAKAGAMHAYFRGNPEGRNPLEFLRDRERIRPEYRDRDARLAVMDAQGLEATWLFPTLGVLYEELLKHDPEAVTATFTAFNRWLEEDWASPTATGACYWCGDDIAPGYLFCCGDCRQDWDKAQYMRRITGK